MADLNKVIFRLEKISGENLGQNPDNLQYFLMKHVDYESEDAKNLIEEFIVANVMKSVIFNSKVADRIVRMDSVVDDTIFIPEIREIDCHDEENNATAIIEDTQISLEQQRSSNHNISAILEKCCPSLKAIDKQILKIEDHVTGLKF